MIIKTLLKELESLSPVLTGSPGGHRTLIGHSSYNPIPHEAPTVLAREGHVRPASNKAGLSEKCKSVVVTFAISCNAHTCKCSNRRKVGQGECKLITETTTVVSEHGDPDTPMQFQSQLSRRGCSNSFPSNAPLPCAPLCSQTCHAPGQAIGTHPEGPATSARLKSSEKAGSKQIKQ